MRAYGRDLRAFLTLGLLCSVLSLRPAATGQMPTFGSGSVSPASSNPNARHRPEDDMDLNHFPGAESMQRMQNAERQKRLVSDTERLLALTNQLKASISDAGSDAPTPEMLRQMDEIEKLARSVKNRMRN